MAKNNVLSSTTRCGHGCIMYRPICKKYPNVYRWFACVTVNCTRYRKCFLVREDAERYIEYIIKSVEQWEQEDSEDFEPDPATLIQFGELCLLPDMADRYLSIVEKRMKDTKQRYVIG